jgi:hypothetical protein
MSITITTDVFCDGCGIWVSGYCGVRPNSKKARQEARANGWKCESMGDFCPQCREKLAHVTLNGVTYAWVKPEEVVNP